MALRGQLVREVWCGEEVSRIRCLRAVSRRAGHEPRTQAQDTSRGLKPEARAQEEGTRCMSLELRCTHREHGGSNE